MVQILALSGALLAYFVRPPHRQLQTCRHMMSSAAVAYTINDAVEGPPLEIKKSKFIGCVAPCATVEAALGKVQEARAKDPKARHWCWAWRGGLGSGETRSSDDGEPASTAGKPILAAIEGEDLYSVIVVVTRYFGGIELGTGGLVRAYGQCARDALAISVKVPIQSFARIDARFASHEDASRAYSLMTRNASTKKLAEAFADDGSVSVAWEVLAAERTGLCSQLVDLTKGRAAIADIVE